MEQVEQTLTVAGLTEQAARVQKLRAEYAEASAAKTAANDALEAAEKEMIKMLEDSKLTSYKCEYGHFIISYRTSVKLPKTPEDRAKFFAWLRDEGYFDTHITVNSQKLNGLYKAEFSAAQERGDEAWGMPGITEVTLEPNLGVRKA